MLAGVFYFTVFVMAELNIYSLTRNYWDFAFENPDKVKPIHAAIFMYAVERCNRLGWKDKFQFPSYHAMEAVGVRSHKTYMKAFKELVQWGFIEVHEWSKNRDTATIIALVNFTEVSTEAHTKAIAEAERNSEPKQVQSEGALVNFTEAHTKANTKASPKHVPKRGQPAVTKEILNTTNYNSTNIQGDVSFSEKSKFYDSLVSLFQSIGVPKDLDSDKFRKRIFDFNLMWCDRDKRIPAIQTIEAQYMKLLELQKLGDDPVKVIEYAIQGGWRQFYNLPEEKQKSNGQPVTPGQHRSDFLQWLHQNTEKPNPNQLTE